MTKVLQEKPRLRTLHGFVKRYILLGSNLLDEAKDNMWLRAASIVC